MSKRISLVLILIIFISCGPRIIVPPEIDLVAYEQIGLISFTIENAMGPLDEIATQHFLREMTRAQKGIQIIELGTLNEVLGKIDKRTLGREAAKAIGKHFGVPLFFYGRINVSDVKPQDAVSALLQDLRRIRAYFNISMTARLLSTKTGAILWASSVGMKETVAYIRVDQRMIPHFNIKSQDRAYRRMIKDLIYELIKDFLPNTQVSKNM